MFPLSLIIILLLTPLLLVMLFFNIAQISFEKLGLSSELATLFLLGSLLGSIVNIPLSRKKVIVSDHAPFGFPFLFYFPPKVSEQIIAINFGGAIIPILLSIFLLQTAPLIPTLGATVVMIILSKLLARPVPGVGIGMPAFIPPIVAALLALIFAPLNPAPVAYISGVLGVLIGADLLNLGEVRKMEALMMSIGGAGVFDGIFLVGVISVFLT